MLFEIEVIEKKSGESDFILFIIEINSDVLIAEHVALTVQEELSDKVAFKEVDFDDSFSIDENLQALYTECIQGIINSDFYELKE